MARYHRCMNEGLYVGVKEQDREAFFAAIPLLVKPDEHALLAVSIPA
ncbi:hypothetical protein Ga0123462_2159 [Mariprofundus ferrinatatus]|uniref:Uncharacterized protein n=1 Tax=Mariprofundus ferrinatatus TaxID=1921087 RepID=A0A2K8LDK8_9PROT|nr:hypothetical protein [Mariprofundus ferrinatatus]ATX82994.1 hypothetical protein Ga0123462_2159 [Mariprofundus ferrinatatus]